MFLQSLSARVSKRKVDMRVIREMQAPEHKPEKLSCQIPKAAAIDRLLRY